MPVNILNLSDLRVLDFKEIEREYHIKAEPVTVARLCPHCGKSHEVIGHSKLPLTCAICRRMANTSMRSQFYGELSSSVELIAMQTSNSCIDGV